MEEKIYIWAKAKSIKAKFRYSSDEYYLYLEKFIKKLAKWCEIKSEEKVSLESHGLGRGKTFIVSLTISKMDNAAIKEFMEKVSKWCERQKIKDFVYVNYKQGGTVKVLRPGKE